MEKKMNTVQDYVQRILKRDKRARNSDRLLSYEFFKDYYRLFENKDLDKMTVKDFLLDHKAPTMETVRRCRQKCQEQHEELRADSDVREVRAIKQAEICEWALKN